MRFLKAINHDLGNTPQSKAFDALYSLCRVGYALRVPAAITTMLCQKALSMIASGVSADELAESDLRSIVISGFEIER